MTDDLKRELGEDALDVKLIEGKRGSFEVSANGELIFSRLETGEFPESEEISKLIKTKIGV